MLLKKLRIKNIRSYKEQEINFPEGSVLLMGDIGSGKTSVLLAIEFALFGLQPGQKGNSLLRNSEEEARVELEFEIDEKTIKIERKIQKGSKSISQADCSITINNERFEGSVTEIKNKILTILNYPPEFAKKTNDLYKFTVYTPQEEMKQIISESNDTKLNTLRHVFGIDKYKRIEENTEIITAKLRQEIRIKEAEMGSIESRKQAKSEKESQKENRKIELSKAESEISEIQKIKESKQQEIELLAKKMQEKNKLENEKDKSELTLNNKKDMLITYDKEIKNLNEQIKSAGNISFKESEIEAMKNHIKVQDQIIKELNDSFIRLTTQIQSNEMQIKELVKLRDKISALDKCPTCLQIVGGDYKNNIVQKAVSELRVLESETNTKRKEKIEIEKKLDSSRKLLEEHRLSLSRLEVLKVRIEGVKEKEARAKNIEKQKISVLADIDLIRKHIEGLESLLKEFEAYDLVYEKKNREFKDIAQKENQLVGKKAGINAEIKFLEKQILDLENEIKKIEELGLKLNRMRELEFWLNNKFLEFVLHTEKNVMLKLREDFSNLFSNWFSVLVSDTMSVRLDESFSPIIQQNDYEINYSYLSGGERTAVALAYRLALNQTINSLLSKIKTRDIVILDEPTDGFSDSQLDKMRDVLQQLKVRQLILVSHEQKIEGFVNSIIKFKKIDGVTVVES